MHIYVKFSSHENILFVYTLLPLIIEYKIVTDRIYNIVDMYFILGQNN